MTTVYQIIKLNIIDVNGIYTYEGEELSFVHFCVKRGNLFLLKLLYIIGADLNLKDKKGLKPIDYVNIQEQKSIYDYHTFLWGS